jgi:CubicO group peptidase (beta-lactamase class C family)
MDFLKIISSRSYICTLFLIILSLTCFSSCGSFHKEPETDDSLGKPISLPTPPAINPEYVKQVANVCNNWYNQFLKKSAFYGGMIVAKNGNILFEKYNGVAHVGYNDSINANTPLHIASVSKTFTAMAVLKLWQDKKLNIDDQFSKYFPEFNYPGVTVRSLLNHRSGLPNYVYFMDEIGWSAKTFVTNLDVLKTLISKKNVLRNINPPNKHFAYCNTNYALLALLIEKVTSMTYPEYLKKSIFEPLKMNNSFVYRDKDSARTTPSYDYRNYQAVFINLDKVYGDKNIFSTPQDLLKWDRLLSSGLYLNKVTLDEAYKPYSNEKSGVRNYGLGWRMYNFPHKKIIYHNGWWHGSNAVFIRLIEEDATIIVIGNKYNRNIYKAKELIGIFTGPISTENDDE